MQPSGDPNNAPLGQSDDYYEDETLFTELLTEKERMDVEKLKRSLNDGVRLSNQVLKGDIKFNEWKMHAKKIIGNSHLAMLSNVKFNDDPSGSEKTSLSNRARLLKEVTKHLQNELYIPVEATMEGRLKSCLKYLQSISLSGEKGMNIDVINTAMNDAQDELFGALESPLSEALEGFDFFVETERTGASGELKSSNGSKLYDLEKSITTNFKSHNNVRGSDNDNPELLTVVPSKSKPMGYIKRLRGAISKIQGLQAFVLAMIGPNPNTTQLERGDVYDVPADNLSWWKQPSSKAVSRSPETLNDLIRSIEAAAPTTDDNIFSADRRRSKSPQTLSELVQSVESNPPQIRQREIAVVHSTDRNAQNLSKLVQAIEGDSPTTAQYLSSEQMIQVVKYVVSNVIDDDINPVLDRLAMERKHMLGGQGGSVAQPLGSSQVDSLTKINGARNKMLAQSLPTKLSNVSSIAAKPNKTSELNFFDAAEKSVNNDNEEPFVAELNNEELRISSGKSFSRKSDDSFKTRLSQSKNEHPVNSSPVTSSLDGAVAAEVFFHQQELQKQITAQLAELEEIHREELKKIKLQAEDDRRNSQEKSALEVLELHEQRRQERELFEQQINLEREALLQERERLTEENSSSRWSKIQFILHRYSLILSSLY